MLRKLILATTVMAATVMAATVMAVTQPAFAQLAMGPDAIGPIKRGWTISDILVSGMPYARDVVPTEGDPVTVYTLTVDDKVKVEVSFWADDTPYQLSTNSPVFRTKEGAGVGDTMATLRRLYPRGSISKGMIDGVWLTFLPFGMEGHRTKPVLAFSFDPSGLSDECMTFNTKCPDMADMKSTGFAVTWLN